MLGRAIREKIADERQQTGDAVCQSGKVYFKISPRVFLSVVSQLRVEEVVFGVEEAGQFAGDRVCRDRKGKRRGEGDRPTISIATVCIW